MEAKVAGVIDTLLSVEHVVIIIAAYTIVKTLPGIWPKVFNSKTAKRLKSGAAIFWCIAGKYAYAYYGAESLHHGDLILMGVVLGNAASHGHTFLKGTVFHDGDDEIQTVDEKTGKRMAPSAYKMVRHKAKKLIT